MSKKEKICKNITYPNLEQKKIYRDISNKINIATYLPLICVGKIIKYLNK